ncbi:MAG: LysR family transcriptional regulator [Burkholderiales bacterium]|nr:LysR family transcriptional regulator [Burkholderiales bacterium]
MPVGDLAERLPRHLKLRQLRVLLAVAREGSFRKAGSALHMTQPAVTSAIAELERTLGVPLFERSALGVRPTAHGERFIQRAAAIFGELRLAAQDIESAVRGSRAVFSVGIGGGLWGAGIMPAALAELLDHHPQASISIREAGEDALIELIKAQDLDLAIARLAPLPVHPEFALQPLFEDALRVITGRSHPLARRRRVAWDELADERWVPPPPGTPAFARMELTFARGGAGAAPERRVGRLRSGRACDGAGARFPGCGHRRLSRVQRDQAPPRGREGGSAAGHRPDRCDHAQGARPARPGAAAHRARRQGGARGAAKARRLQRPRRNPGGFPQPDEPGRVQAPALTGRGA